MKQTGTGALFPKDAHKRFMELTGSRYDSMMRRLAKKKLIDPEKPPFTKDQLRAHLLQALGGKEDGFIQCRFCRAYFGIVDIAMDHERALDEGGGIGLDNIGFPCQRCNWRKGKMSPGDFLLLLELLEKYLPHARMDILERLEKAVQFAASLRNSAPTITDLKESGHWQQAQKIRRQRKRDKDAGLGAF